MEEKKSVFTRDNHQKHIVQVMPLITAVFGVQCYLMSQFSFGANIGDMAIILGLSLIAFVGALFFYDNFHQVSIYQDRIESGFGILGQKTTVNFSEIDRIEAPEEEKNFSVLILRLNDDSKKVYYFVDWPKATKDLLEKQIAANAQKEHARKDNDATAA